MTDRIPLKLEDLGNGEGRLREMEEGDTIPYLYLPVGAGAGTVVAGDDERLSDARDWAAEVVSQLEAETGTETAARKWSALRVWQAVLAAFPGAYNSVTTAFTRQLMEQVADVNDLIQGMGLKTAAFQDAEYFATAAQLDGKLDADEWYLGTDKQYTSDATGAVTLDLAAASICDLTLTGNVTLTVINATVPAGETRSVVVRIRQGATARTLTWWSGITWLASTTPAAPGANKIVEYVLSYDGSSWLGRVGASN